MVLDSCYDLCYMLRCMLFAACCVLYTLYAICCLTHGCWPVGLRTFVFCPATQTPDNSMLRPLAHLSFSYLRFQSLDFEQTSSKSYLRPLGTT